MLAGHLVLVLLAVPVGDEDGVPHQEEGETNGEAVDKGVHPTIVDFTRLYYGLFSRHGLTAF
jgi:hypothetical protein